MLSSVKCADLSLVAKNHVVMHAIRSAVIVIEWHVNSLRFLTNPLLVNTDVEARKHDSLKMLRSHT
jgi:hypothetical protein